MYYKITPLHMYRVIETFVKTHAITLPRKLKQHLKWCEDIILIQSAWKQGQDIFQLLHTHQSVVQLQRFTSKTNEAITTRSTTTESTGAQPPPPPKSPSTLLDSFLNKIERIIEGRLTIIFASLGIVKENNVQCVDAVWTSIIYVLTNKWWLLQNRHVDHILLCSIYSVCKMNADHPKLKLITFEQIVTCYCNIIEFIRYPAGSDDVKSAEQALTLTTNILLNVPMTLFPTSILSASQPKLFAAPPTDHLFTYYNTIFLPSMQEFIINLDQQHSLQYPGLERGVDDLGGNNKGNDNGSSDNSTSNLFVFNLNQRSNNGEKLPVNAKTLALIAKTRAEWADMNKQMDEDDSE